MVTVSHAVQRWPLIRLPMPRIAHRHGPRDVVEPMHAPVITVGVPAQIDLAVAIQRRLGRIVEIIEGALHGAGMTGITHTDTCITTFSLVASPSQMKTSLNNS